MSRRYAMRPADPALPLRTEQMSDAALQPGQEQGGDIDDGLLRVAVPLMIACYVIAALSVTVTFWRSVETLLAIAICVLYGVMYFGIPIIMMRIRKTHDQRWRSTEPERSSNMISVCTGPTTRFDAVLQMILVPLAVAILFVSFSTILMFMRP